jgi:hypothetical protein
MKTLEFEILKTLKFKLYAPDVNDFSSHFVGIFDLRDPLHSLYHYLIVTFITNPRFPSFLPSHSAAAVLLLTRKMLQYNVPWMRTLEHHTGYSEKQLNPLCKHLRSFMWLIYVKDFHLTHEFGTGTYNVYYHFCRNVLLAWDSRAPLPNLYVNNK